MSDVERMVVVLERSNLGEDPDAAAEVARAIFRECARQQADVPETIRVNARSVTFAAHAVVLRVGVKASLEEPRIEERFRAARVIFSAVAGDAWRKARGKG